MSARRTDVDSSALGNEPMKYQADTRWTQKPQCLLLRVQKYFVRFDQLFRTKGKGHRILDISIGRVTFAQFVTTSSIDVANEVAQH